MTGEQRASKSETMCAWCAPDNQRVAKGSALAAKSPAGRPVYRRAPSCGLPGHGTHYEAGFMALNIQTLRTEHAAGAYSDSMRSMGIGPVHLGLPHLQAIDAALLAADGFEQGPRLPTPRNFLTDPATSHRVKRAAELGVRDALALAGQQNLPHVPEHVLQRAAEAALGHLMESLDVTKDPTK